jgi:NADH-quinone oxidoreductase subunit H
MLAYDVPLIIVIFGVAYMFGTTNLVQIIEAQQAGGIATWGIVQNPLLAIAGLIALQAMLGKQPFEIYVAPAEIATGPMVEMGGKFLGSLFVMQCFQLYATSVLYTSLFLRAGDPHGHRLSVPPLPHGRHGQAGVEMADPDRIDRSGVPDELITRGSPGGTR